ncbi:MAG: phosphoribosyltransferase family protein [Phototrophicaceae bacterium]
MTQRPHYDVTVAGVSRSLEKFEVAPGVTIAILNILGDTELVLACSKELATRLEGFQPQVFVTAEAKSIPLIYQLSVDTGIPYIVLRKSYKTYMGETIHSETVSITTGSTQTLYLDEKDRALLDGKRVVLVDDVISTGSTLEGMETIIKQTNAHIVARAAIFTEGNEPDKWEDIVALGNLPVWIGDAS